MSGAQQLCDVLTLLFIFLATAIFPLIPSLGNTLLLPASAIFVVFASDSCQHIQQHAIYSLQDGAGELGAAVPL
ncbi:hypothetical protein D3C85_1631710 [compost metagenome]